MRISDWSSDVCSSDLPPRACRFFRREIRLNASPPDRMGQRPSAVEYSPPDDPGTDTEQATHQIGRRRVVRHEEATDDIAADRSGARHRAVDRGDLAMIGGRAFGLQQGPYGDIVNAVGAAAGDEGDANDHKAYRRETDQQHGRAHDRGGSERSQADPAADRKSTRLNSSH